MGREWINEERWKEKNWGNKEGRKGKINEENREKRKEKKVK